MMLNMFLVAAALASGILPLQSGVDMALLKKWEDAKVIRYHVVGVHSARTMVVFGDYEGKADVTDRITLDFVWNKKTRKYVGDVKVTDSKSELKNIRSDGTNCPPPTLNGDYEHFQYVKQSIDSGGQILLTGVRIYPPARVSQYPASCKQMAIPGGKEDAMLSLGPGEPAILAMSVPKSSPISISADRKTFTMPGGTDWLFTFTPSIEP